MNTCFLLIIILDFTHLVHSYDFSDVNERNLYPTCPKSLIRNKRDPTSYMGWRGNLESSSEFIVNIPDEAVPGTAMRGVAGINIMSPRKNNADKIIVGLAIPTPARTSLSNVIEEYTRFPPAAVPVTSVDDVIVAPVSSVDASSIKQSLSKERPESGELETKYSPKSFVAVKNPQRDESPPAAPQFLPRRTTVQPMRQYAPVNTVAFSPHVHATIHSPMTPRHRFDKSRRLMKTTADRDVITPSRTTEAISDLADFVQYIVGETTSDVALVSETTLDVAPITETSKLFNIPRRTTLNLELLFDEDDQDPDKDNTGKSNNAQELQKITTGKSDVKEDVLEATTKKYVKSEDNSYDDKYSDDYNYDSNDKEVQTENFTDSGSQNTEDEYSDGIASYINASNEKYNLTTQYVNERAIFKSTALKWREGDKEICSLLKLRSLGFNSPRTLKEIVKQLKHWAENSPMVKWTDLTQGNLTTMENPIYMMIVDDPSSGQIVTAKRTVMIVAGILGKDHHAVAAAMYVLYQLIDRSDSHVDLLTKFRFWVVPVFNPDGYDYSLTFPHRKGWTKNLHQTWEECDGKEHCKDCQSTGIGCIIQSCFGTNLDRNFEYQWIPVNELHADQKCGSLYPGPRQLSEAETKAFTIFMHKQKVPLHMFIAFKEGDVLGIMYPYSHTKKQRAHDYLHRQRATRAANAANSISGRSYVSGQSSEFLPLYAGGIEDWVDGHLGVDNTFTIMMYRTSDMDHSKLIMERVVHEAYAAMDTLLLHAPDAPPAPAITSLKHLKPIAYSSQPAQRSAFLITVTTALSIFLFS